MFPKALKSGLKSNKSPNLVTLKEMDKEKEYGFKTKKRKIEKSRQERLKKTRDKMEQNIIGTKCHKDILNSVAASYAEIMRLIG